MSRDGPRQLSRRRVGRLSPLCPFGCRLLLLVSRSSYRQLLCRLLLLCLCRLFSFAHFATLRCRMVGRRDCHRGHGRVWCVCRAWWERKIVLLLIDGQGKEDVKKPRCWTRRRVCCLGRNWNLTSFATSLWRCLNCATSRQEPKLILVGPHQCLPQLTSCDGT